MSLVKIKTVTTPTFNQKEALRYAGCATPNDNILAILSETKTELWGNLTYKVCYCELEVNITDDILDFGCFNLKSKDLTKNLKGCKKVLLFGATVGISVDRLITKYGKISPTKALMAQSIGAERIEALCDAFCKDFETENGIKLKPRFSPGYGDLDISIQKQVFNLLDCPKNIGLTLSDSFMMSPSKSVTAFAGITE